MPALNARAAAAEFIAMTFFVYICCGSATRVAHTAGWVQQVALTFGMCIMVLAYTIGHHSGGQINPAVTLALACLGKIGVGQGFANAAAQLAGAIFGSLLLRVTVGPPGPGMGDKTAGLAINLVSQGTELWQAFVAEVLGTALLVLTVLETAISAKGQGSIAVSTTKRMSDQLEANRRMACLAIGGSVYLAHSILIPIDGCSINPTRSLGPAMVAAGFSSSYEERRDIMKDQWVFIAGPLVGALLAAGVWKYVMPCERPGKK